MAEPEPVCELSQERINFVERVVDEVWRIMSRNDLIVAEGAMLVYQLVDRIGETMEQNGSEENVDGNIDQVIDFLQRMHAYCKTGDEEALLHGI